MGQASTTMTKGHFLRRRRPSAEDMSKGTTPQSEQEESNPISVNISGRNYVLRDANWVLEMAHACLRPLDREARVNKMADVLNRENASLRQKIARLYEMLNLSQYSSGSPVLDKKIDGLLASQEHRISTVNVQTENLGQLHLLPPSQAGIVTTGAPYPLLKTSDLERISQRLDGIIFGVGQPLLDVVAKVTLEFLASFHLPDEEVHELQDNEMGIVSLLFEVFPVEYLTGGSTQNCLIMSQWLLAIPKATTFAGCIGKDNIGDILTKTLTEAGINIILRVIDTHETGLCIVFDSSRGRRTALRLGAIRNSIRAAFDQPQHRALLSKARCYYAEAYTLTYALEAALELGRFAAANDRQFCLNLTATHASLDPAKGVSELLPYVDVIFAGEEDTRTYAALLGLVVGEEDGLDECALGLSGWRKENGLKGRVVVVVRPARDLVVVRDGQLAIFPSMSPGPGSVVDDIGFVDAFAGGYMTLLVLGGSVDECLEAGVRAAAFSLLEKGCAPPKPVQLGVRKLSRRESMLG